MDALALHAAPRSIIGKKVKNLRNQGIVPGIIYGHEIDTITVQFDEREITKALSQAGMSSTMQVDLEGKDETMLTIFRDVQVHPIKRAIIHVDLQALDLTETVRVPVSVVLVGDAPAAEEGGVLLQLLNELEIEALPMDLVPNIEVDVSGLDEIGKSIQVADIAPPEGVNILNAPEETIAQVSWIEEEEEEELEAAPELIGEVEVITSREEGEEGEEGEVEEPEEA